MKTNGHLLWREITSRAITGTLLQPSQSEGDQESPVLREELVGHMQGVVVVELLWKEEWSRRSCNGTWREWSWRSCYGTWREWSRSSCVV